MVFKWLVLGAALALGASSKYAKRILPITPVDLSGKTFIVTGASAGIGKETVRALADWNATVIAAVRNPSKMEAVLEDIKATTRPDIDVEVWELDLASLASTKAFAQKFLDSGKPLHVLINNAGLVSWDHVITEDGHELTHQTNHLGHFLLTKLLLPRLQESAPARVLQISSEAHYMGKIDLDNLDPPKESYNAMKTYGNTKLMNVLFANEFTKRFKDSGVVSTSLHPGFVATDFLRDVPKWLDPVKAAILGAFARNEFEGAKTQILAATAPEYESVGGIYFDSCKPKKPLAAALNETLAALFWEVSEENVKDFATVVVAEESG